MPNKYWLNELILCIFKEGINRSNIEQLVYVDQGLPLVHLGKVVQTSLKIC